MTSSPHALATAAIPTFDTSVYHGQQTAEKAVKAFLIFHDEEIEKTHNVTALMADASVLDPRFTSLLGAARLLTSYAVAYRYPRNIPDPTEDECEEAIAAAIEIYDFVLSVLPSETHPTGRR